MKVFILRHGATDYNKQGLLQGLLDTPLNDDGKQQAIITGELLGEENIDIIYTSPLIRAKETASLLHLDVPIYVDERLIERDLGVYEGKPIKQFNRLTYASYHDIDRKDNVETVTEVYDRISSFFEELKQKGNQSGIVIVTHGGVIKVIRNYFNGIPNNGICNEKSISNCDMLTFEL